LVAPFCACSTITATRLLTPMGGYAPVQDDAQERTATRCSVASRAIGFSSMCTSKSSAFAKTMAAPAFSNSVRDIPQLSTPTLGTSDEASWPRRPPSRLKPRTPISARRVRDLSVAVGCNRPPPKRPWSISYLGRGRSRMPPVSSKNAHRPSSSTSMRQPGSVLWATESANHACATSALSISLLATTLPRGSITLNATMRCDYPRRSVFTPFFTARGSCQ
jgi:hypothetical protein